MEIDIASVEAVYEQIVRQIQQGVSQGTLVAGTALPSIRQLAEDLDLNHNTVAKAYRILENNRVIRTAGRKGTFIHSDAQSQIHSRANQDAAYLMEELVASLFERGLSVAQIEAVFHCALKARRAPTT